MSVCIQTGFTARILHEERVTRSFPHDACVECDSDDFTRHHHAERRK